MRILIVCRHELYNRLSLPFMEKGVDRTNALTTWDQVVSELHSGADGIVIEEGVSFASTVKSLPYAKLVYAGNTDYNDQALQWLEQLRFKKERAANVEEVVIPEQKDDEREIEDKSSSESMKHDLGKTEKESLPDEEKINSLLQSDQVLNSEANGRVEEPINSFKEVNVTGAISHLTEKVRQASMPLLSLKRKDESNFGKLLVVGGGTRVGKTWMISTMLGLLGERCRAAAIDRDGSLSGLWRIDAETGLHAVYGRSVVAKAGDDQQQLEELLQMFEVVIIEVSDVTEWLEAGAHAMFVVDNDPFHFYEAAQAPWNQMDWEGKLTVVLNRSPHLLSRKYTDRFLRHACFQVPNQGVPMELVYRDVEPILSTSVSFRNAVLDLIRKPLNRSQKKIKKM